jgi:heme exporter protein A
MRLVADNLSCDRGGRNVFSALSFSVSSGQALVVTGRNGSGKSSLLRVVAGLLRAQGRLRLEGGRDELTLAEQTHYLGHQDALKPMLSVAENLTFWSAYLGGAQGTRALTMVGLETLADLPAGYLSAGQRRRLSIARLLAARRPLWLLDEPTAALDAASEKQLASIMRSHLKSGGIILAAAHGGIGLQRARTMKLDA